MRYLTFRIAQNDAFILIVVDSCNHSVVVTFERFFFVAGGDVTGFGVVACLACSVHLSMHACFLSGPSDIAS